MTSESVAARLASPGPPAVAAARPRLRHSFGWTLAGNVVWAGSQWGLVVVLARLASPEALGTFALALAITAPAFLLAGLHLRASQATDAARTFRFGDYLAVRIAGMAVALAGLFALEGLSGRGLAASAVVLAVGATKVVEGLSDVHHGALQQHERMRPIAISLVAKGGLSVLAFAMVLAAGGGLLAAVVAMGVAWLLVLVLWDVPAAGATLRSAGEARGPRLDRAAAGRLVATSLPLGLVMMLVSLRVNVPRYFLERFVGTAGLGEFAALASLLVAGGVVVNALGQAATPRLAALHLAGDRGGFRALVLRLLALGAGLGVAGVVVAAVAGEPILRLLFGARFAGRADVLVLLMAIGVPANTASILGFALTAARRFAVQLPVFAGTTAACAALCAWLVPADGLRGAALAWGGSMLLEVAAVGLLLALTLRRLPAGRRTS